MQEEYLHYLWRMKRLDFRQLTLVNGNKSAVQVKETGWYNTDAGPDFFNGSVLIDGLQWSGNIEMHIRSSDWYLHNHHLDKAYDNVVLHVVYEHDKEVFVNGVALPTIALKNQLDQEHLDNYQRIISNNHKIACHNQILKFNFELNQQLDISFLQRIERKGLLLFDSAEEVNKDALSLAYLAIFKAVGGRVNALPMEELAKKIPYSILLKEGWDAQRIQAVLFGTAGFLNEECEDEYFLHLQKQWQVLKRKYGLSEMNKNTWKFNGIRSSSFPTYILAQLSAFLLQFDFSNFEGMEVNEIRHKVLSIDASHIHSYWTNHFRFGVNSKRVNRGFTTLFKMNLLINGIVPYLVVLKHLKNDFSFSDKAMELMENLPAEQNNIIKEWNKVGIYAKNAFESQALLELYNEFCIFKKCLSCKIGSSILEK